MEGVVLNIYKDKLKHALKAFDEFCTLNNLCYYVCCGTAIGAVRHKGFIPWDDDIDVYMPRKDYNRLLAIRNKLENTNYRVVALGDDGYIYPFAKFCDKNTTLLEFRTYPTCCIGVFVDVFPLDEVCGDYCDIQKKKIEYDRLYSWFQLSYIKPDLRWFLANIYYKNLKELGRCIFLRFCSSGKKKVIRNKFLDYEKKWMEEKGDILFFHHCSFSIEKELFAKEWFQSYIYIEFEDIKVRINTWYDKYLTMLYGDYMTLPPIEKRQSTHSHYYLNLKECLPIDEVMRRIAKGEHIVY